MTGRRKEESPEFSRLRSALSGRRGFICLLIYKEIMQGYGGGLETRLRKRLEEHDDTKLVQTEKD